jgi:hypothetical protein
VGGRRLAPNRPSKWFHGSAATAARHRRSHATTALPLRQTSGALASSSRSNASRQGCRESRICSFTANSIWRSNPWLIIGWRRGARRWYAQITRRRGADGIEPVERQQETPGERHQTDRRRRPRAINISGRRHRPNQTGPCPWVKVTEEINGDHQRWPSQIEPFSSDRCRFL